MDFLEASLFILAVKKGPRMRKHPDAASLASFVHSVCFSDVCVVANFQIFNIFRMSWETCTHTHILSYSKIKSCRVHDGYTTTTSDALQSKGSIHVKTLHKCFNFACEGMQTHIAVGAWEIRLTRPIQTLVERQKGGSVYNCSLSRFYNT